MEIDISCNPLKIGERKKEIPQTINFYIINNWQGLPEYINT